MSNLKNPETYLMCIFLGIYVILFAIQSEITLLSSLFDIIFFLVQLRSIIISFGDDTIIIKHTDLVGNFEVIKSSQKLSSSNIQNLESNDNLLETIDPKKFVILEEIDINQNQLFNMLKDCKEKQADLKFDKKKKTKQTYLMRFMFFSLSFLALNHFIRVLRRRKFYETATPFLIYFMIIMTLIGLIAFVLYSFENGIIKNKLVAEINFLLNLMNDQRDKLSSLKTLIDRQDNLLFFKKILPDWDLTLFFPNFSMIRSLVVFIFTMHILTQLFLAGNVIFNFQFSDQSAFYISMYYLFYFLLITLSIISAILYKRNYFNKTFKFYIIGALFLLLILFQTIFHFLYDSSVSKPYRSLHGRIMLYTEAFYFLVIGFHFYLICKYSDDLYRYIKLKWIIEEILQREYNNKLLNFNPKGLTKDFQSQEILSFITKKNSLENLKNLPPVPDKTFTFWATLAPIVITLGGMIYQLYQNWGDILLKIF